MTLSTWRAIAEVAGIVGLAGCAGTAPPAMRAAPPGAVVATSPCAGPEAQVTISQVTISGGSATIQVNPGSRSIDPTGGGVRWKFSQNVYSFTGDGVTFKANQPAGPASAPPTYDPTQFVWCFNNTTSTPDATWNYTIKFSANAAPSKVWSCDPTIINRGGKLDAEAVMTVNCQ